MLVMKFGGTSLATGDRLRVVVGLVRQALPRDPVLVVSAHGNTTDLLIRAAEAALGGELEHAAVEHLHHALLADLQLPGDLLAEPLQELQDLLRGVVVLQELPARTLDLVLSFGERLSSRLVAAMLRQEGIDATAVEAPAAGLLTDGCHGCAAPLPEAYEGLGRSLRKVPGIPVVTGFLGLGPEGQITTLGRSGSDLTAAIVGAALEAEEIQIWTDVEGVLTADPEVVPHATVLPHLSFEEAAEIAQHGARVLHPATVQPGLCWAVPVQVRSTLTPTAQGTRISHDPPPPPGAISAVVHRELLSLAYLDGRPPTRSFELLGRSYALLQQAGLDHLVLATSEHALTLAVEAPAGTPPLSTLLAPLAGEATVRVRTDCSLVAVVGRGMRARSDLPARILEAVAARGVPVHTVTQGAYGVSLLLVVPRGCVRDLVRAIHARFLEQTSG